MRPGGGGRRPRLGFLGVGWIGRHRLEALVRSGVARVAGYVDPSPAACAAAKAVVPAAVRYGSYGEMLRAGLDGVVIATPSAGHAREAIRALRAGVPVFCQKPLGRNAAEVAEVLEVAASADRFLAVDFSYRWVEAVRRARELVRSGRLGRVYAADLAFHNAYGPDKKWFYDPARSGGGCVMDLGSHLVDLLLWCLEAPTVRRVDASLFAGGLPLSAATEGGAGAVEDFAEVRLLLDGRRHARIACSWNLHAGEDASVHLLFHGTEGGARVHNVGGSFYDFRAEHLVRTGGTVLAEPPDPWGGRALVAWAARIARLGPGYDPECRCALATARVLDAAYESARGAGAREGSFA